MRRMLAPASHRCAIDWLAHLINARGAHRALGFVKPQYPFVPGQAEEVEHPPRFALEFVEHGLVVHLEKWDGSGASGGGAGGVGVSNSGTITTLTNRGTIGGGGGGSGGRTALSRCPTKERGPPLDSAAMRRRAA
jgi:hypothetical protein